MPATGQRPPPSRDAPQRRRPGALLVGVAQAAVLADRAWQRLRPWRGWRWIGHLGAILFVVALPMALVGTNVRLLFSAAPLYTFAVEQYDVPDVTGIPRLEIDRAMTEIRDYFTNDQQLLRITVSDDSGRTNPIFTPREVIHMRDVKQLVQAIFRARLAAFAIVSVYALARLLAQRRTALAGLARLTRISMLGTLAVALGFGAASLLGFERLFEQFHLLSFSNDFWQLDPRRDHLVQMFPLDFWLVSTVILLGITLVEVLTLLGLSWWYLQRAVARSSATAEEKGSGA